MLRFSSFFPLVHSPISRFTGPCSDPQVFSHWSILQSPYSFSLAHAQILKFFPIGPFYNLRIPSHWPILMSSSVFPIGPFSNLHVPSRWPMLRFLKFFPIGLFSYPRVPSHWHMLRSSSVFPLVHSPISMFLLIGPCSDHQVYSHWSILRSPCSFSLAHAHILKFFPIGPFSNLQVFPIGPFSVSRFFPLVYSQISRFFLLFYAQELGIFLIGLYSQISSFFPVAPWSKNRFCWRGIVDEKELWQLNLVLNLRAWRIFSFSISQSSTIYTKPGPQLRFPQRNGRTLYTVKKTGKCQHRLNYTGNTGAHSLQLFNYKHTETFTRKKPHP